MKMVGWLKYACGCTDSWSGTERDILPAAHDPYECPTHGQTWVTESVRRSR